MGSLVGAMPDVRASSRDELKRYVEAQGLPKARADVILNLQEMLGEASPRPELIHTSLEENGWRVDAAAAELLESASDPRPAARPKSWLFLSVEC